MRNLITRTISGAVMVWLVLEGTAAEGIWYYVLWGAIFALSMGEFLWLVARKPLANKATWTIGGILYIALAGGVVALMREEWQYLVALLTIVWANDVGAYLVGISIGKHKMAPKISPKKSWEGFFGGLFFAIAVSLVWQIFYFSKATQIGAAETNTSLQMILWGVMGLFVGLAAVGGDLLESAFKRRIGVKDSGKIIPGHGGMLDRFDALLLALPVFYLIINLINHII